MLCDREFSYFFNESWGTSRSPSDFTVNFSLSRVQHMSVVLICAGCCIPASALIEQNGKKHKDWSQGYDVWLLYCCSSCPIKSHKMYWKSIVQPVVDQASLRCCWRNYLKFLCVSMLLSAKPQREKLGQNQRKPKNSSFCTTGLQFLHHLCDCLTCTSVSVSLERGSSGLDSAHQMRFTSAEQRRIISLDLLEKLFLVQPKKLFTFFDARVHCWCVFNLMSSERCFSANLPSVWSAPSISWHMKLFFLSCRAWHFPLLNIMTSSLAHFSSLLMCLWVAVQRSGSSTTPIGCKLAVGALWPHHPHL